MAKPPAKFSVTVTGDDPVPRSNGPSGTLTTLTFGNVVCWQPATPGDRVVVEFLDGESPFGWSIAMSSPGQPLFGTIVEQLPAHTPGKAYKYRASDGRTGHRNRASDPEIVVDGGRDTDK